MTGNALKDCVIVLPSLDPDRKFSAVVMGLVEKGFEKIVIVDDGSDAGHQRFFEEAESYPQCSVIHHGVNKGKGRALKTAFEYIINNYPEAKGAVTIDGDGQHLLEDIYACANRMLEEEDRVILGSRDFDQEGVPPRSVAGNKFTAKMFRLLFGIKINDTQTGLRAIPAAFLPAFCEIKGERFEYETNMLLQMKRSGIRFSEQPIATVYDEEDYSSHYNAFKDSFKVGKVMLAFILSGSMFKYILSSGFSWLADNGIYYLLLAVFGLGHKAVFQAIGTFSSSLLNFNLNKFWVFKSKGSYWKEFLSYYCVCVPRTLLSILFTNLIQNSLGVAAPGPAVAVKILVDAVLFILTYFIQKKWVFKN